MTEHTAVFLERLETYPALPTPLVLYLDVLYRFSQITNSEIRMPFYLVALKEPTSHVSRLYVRQVLDWVTGKDTGIIQGRMKFCRPLFRAANKVDRKKTVAAYCSARTLFHPIARKLIEQVCLSYLSVLGDMANHRAIAGSGVERLLSRLNIVYGDISLLVPGNEVISISDPNPQIRQSVRSPIWSARDQAQAPLGGMSQNNHARARSHSLLFHV